MTSTESAASRRTRVITVIAATVISLACGTNYVYSAWAPQFAQRLQLSTTQANLIGTMGNLGMYASGVPLGMLVDSKGPRWGVSLGIVLFAGGYYPLAGAFDAGPGEYGIPSLCLFSFFTGAGSSSAFSASIKAAAISWPEHRGTATAFPLAAFGLSAFFFATVALAFPHDTSHFLLTLATGTVVLPIIAWFFLKTPSPDKLLQLPDHESQRLHRTKPADRSALHRRALQRASATTPRSPETTPSKPTNPEPDEEDNDSEHASLLSKSSSSGPSTPSRPNTATAHPSSDPKHHHDIRGLPLLRHIEFYQLFTLLALMCGIGLMTINNIGNVAQALWKSYQPDVTDAYIAKRQVLHVSILSVCSFAGRLTSGIGSDVLVRTFNRSRYWCVFLSACVFTAAQIAAITLTNPNFLVLVSGLTGIAYGMLFGVYPSLVAHAFGVGGLSTNWGTMTLAPAISGNIFNLIYGAIYDSHSTEHERGHSECLMGRRCYSAAYWMTFGASLAACGICLWAIRYENVLHQRVEREKRRESGLPDEGGRRYADVTRASE